MTSWNAAAAQWRAALGEAAVDDAAQAQRRYGADTCGYTRRLAGAVRVQTREEIQFVLRIARQQQLPMHPISTGRNWGYGSALPAGEDCTLLDLGGMKRILHFDETFGIVTVEPGVTQGELAAFLDERQLPYLVPVTGAGPSCSLLSNALERGYGVTPHTDHFAAVTDLEAVLPDGSLYQGMLREAAGAELARLFRWSLGPYTHGLFTQSGMGVVTQMSIALAPRPECVMVCLFGLSSDDKLEAGVQAIRQAMQRLNPTLGAVNLMNRHRVLSMSAPYPPLAELDAQARMPQEMVEALGRQYQVMPWTGFATLYGSKRMVKAAKAELKACLGGVASRLMFLTPERAHTLAHLTGRLPRSLAGGVQRLTATLAKSLELVAGRPNETALPLAYWRNPGFTPDAGRARQPAEDGCGLIWYAPLVPMQAQSVRQYVGFVDRVTKAHRLEPLVTFTTVNDRLFDSTVPLVFDRSDAQATAQGQACYQTLLMQGREMGFFPYRLSIGAMEQLRALAPNACRFAQSLHALHDPSNLLAAQRYR
jgi:4-cresol dehydrogenase (hydroxylating) flavoprotein subunit